MDARLSNRWIDDSVRDLKYDYNHKMALAFGLENNYYWFMIVHNDGVLDKEATYCNGIFLMLLD
jgi:hypothetical protein